MSNMACRRLNPDEIGKVAEALRGTRKGPRDAALFILGITTGFRISELLSLRVGDVMDDLGVRPTVTVKRRNMKRKQHGRTMDIVPLAASALKEWVKWAFTRWGVSYRDHLFCKSDGSPISRQEAWRILKRAYRRAGVRGAVATHSMRKTFVSMAREYARANVDDVEPLMFAQRMAGHARIDSTVKYLETADDGERTACAEAIGSSLEKCLHNGE